MRGLLWVFLAIGCKGDKDAEETGMPEETGTPDEEGPTQEELFATWVNTTDTYVGDLTCYDGTSWVTTGADPSCEATVPIGEGEVADFAFGTSVADATVEFYLADWVEGSADLTFTTDGDGLITGSLPVCTAMTYAVTKDDGSLHDTYEYHVMYGAGETVNPDLASISADTWLTLPSLFGVTIDDTLGVLAGTVRDCNGDIVENAQVLPRNADGEIPSTMSVGYTLDGYPNRNENSTTTDGVWIAMNVPAGEYTIEVYVADGAGGQRMVGSVPAQAFVSSVSIAVVYAGREDGLDIPSSCLDCSGG